jgi:hypothetical protein
VIELPVVHLVEKKFVSNDSLIHNGCLIICLMIPTPNPDETCRGLCHKRMGLIAALGLA